MSAEQLVAPLDLESVEKLVGQMDGKSAEMSVGMMVVVWVVVLDDHWVESLAAE